MMALWDILGWAQSGSHFSNRAMHMSPPDHTAVQWCTVQRDGAQCIVPGTSDSAQRECTRTVYRDRARCICHPLIVLWWTKMWQGSLWSSRRWSFASTQWHCHESTISHLIFCVWQSQLICDLIEVCICFSASFWKSSYTCSHYTLEHVLWWWRILIKPPRLWPILLALLNILNISLSFFTWHMKV